jgi:two-component system response regulator PilR (NtrC family)
MMDLSPEKSTRVNGVITHEGYLIGGEVVRIGATVIAVKRTERRTTTELPRSSFGRIHGEHPEMVALYPTFAQLAHEEAPLFILGERGTGKRLLAEELHAHGPVRTGPFVSIARGEPEALTPEAIDAASGGTLYLEEGADFDRVVLDHVLRLDDIRVIVGTRGAVPLPVLVGRRVALPPLRARASDVAVLARKLWTELGGEDSFPDDFVARFEEHTWPGNVRELRIAVHDRILHGQDTTVSGVVEVVPSRASSAPPPADAMAEVCEKTLPFAEARGEILAEFERRYVGRALEKAGNNVARAAANSGIAHRYFQVLKSRRKTA